MQTIENADETAVDIEVIDGGAEVRTHTSHRIFGKIVHVSKTAYLLSANPQRKRSYNTKGTQHTEIKLLPLIPMPQAARPDYIARLEGYQSEGWNVYVLHEPFSGGAVSDRKEKFVEDIRNLFIETDKKNSGWNASPLIKTAVDAGIILAPQTILESSPGNYHIAWNIEGDAFTPAEAKAMLKKFVSNFGGDMASADLHLGLPGFNFLKYGNDCFVKLVELNTSAELCTLVQTSRLK